MDLGLKDKVVLVTGGSEGIGKAAAWRFAHERAKVIICARRQDVLEKAAKEIKKETGGDVLPIVADVTEPVQIKSMIDQVISAYGRIDILVNNAGTSAAGLFEDVSDAEWAADLDLKLYAAIRCSRMVLSYMKDQEGGRIINVTHVGGKTPGSRSVPTSVSRAAGIALTKAMSKDYARDNILVNTVCVGLLKAGQHEKRYAELQERNPGLTLEQWYAERGQGVPMGRVGESHEAGDVIVFLASNMASYVTGASINVDGGTGAVV